MMDDKARDIIYSMLGYIRVWQDDVDAGLLPTRGSLSAAQMELVQAMEPEDVEAAGLTDREEFEAAHAGRR